MGSTHRGAPWLLQFFKKLFITSVQGTRIASLPKPHVCQKLGTVTFYSDAVLYLHEIYVSDDLIGDMESSLTTDNQKEVNLLLKARTHACNQSNRYQIDTDQHKPRQGHETMKKCTIGHTLALPPKIDDARAYDRKTGSGT